MYVRMYVYVFMLFQVQLQSDELGKHLSEVETLLQQHQMQETSLEAYKQHIAMINEQADEFADKKCASNNVKCKCSCGIVILRRA